MNKRQCINCNKPMPLEKSGLTYSRIGGHMVSNQGNFFDEYVELDENGDYANYLPGISDNTNTLSANHSSQMRSYSLQQQQPAVNMPATNQGAAADYEMDTGLPGNPYEPSEIKYLNGFMRSQIGRNIGIEMLIGTNNVVEREGILSVVGSNYFVLHDPKSQKYTAYSFYEVKSVNVPYILDQS